MLGFYVRLLRDFPRVFREAVETVQFWVLTVILAAAGYFGPSLSSKLEPFSRWFVLVPVLGLVLYGLARANYSKFKEIEAERDGLIGKRAASEKERDFVYKMIDALMNVLRQHGTYLAFKDDDEVAKWEAGRSKLFAMIYGGLRDFIEPHEYQLLIGWEVPHKKYDNAHNAQHALGLSRISALMGALQELHNRYAPPR